MLLRLQTVVQLARHQTRDDRGHQSGREREHSVVPGIRSRRKAIWCLFGVCFLEAQESTSET